MTLAQRRELVQALVAKVEIAEDKISLTMRN